jgi:hypothetical protein
MDMASCWKQTLLKLIVSKSELHAETADLEGLAIFEGRDRPARSPVNASLLPSWAAAHDSGSMWIAIPSS